MTERLYYQNSYLTEFEAEVVEQFRRGDRFAVILNQTAFYPLSGGQMADRGFLNDQPVLEVVEEGEEILHLLANPLETTFVVGKVDWPRRFDFMQQHTGFHILAQSFLRVLQVQTVSSHLGEEVDTIDVAVSSLSWEQVERVENLANRIVLENKPVKSYFVTKQDLSTLSLRKPPKFFAKPIRLVDIEDFDLDPCGGTHVKRTGEVGLIKILSWEKVRENLRCVFVAGQRALREFAQQTRVLQELQQILSSPRSELANQASALRQALKEKDRTIKKLQEQLLEKEAEALIKEGQAISSLIWAKEFPQRSPNEIRNLALKICRRVAAVPVFYSTDHQYVVMAANPASDVDFSEAIPEMRAYLSAKGGGGKTFAEFSEIDVRKLGDFLQKVTIWIQPNQKK